MSPTYYTSEYVAEMFTKPPKVCALCDTGFPTKRLVAVDSIDGKPVRDTYVSLSDPLMRRIHKTFGAIDTKINIS